MTLMGCLFDITIVADDEAQAQEYIATAVTEIERIEALISSWSPASQTSMINANAGIQPQKVDAELFDLIKRAIALSHLTDGAFDISYASMDAIWAFDGSMTSLPDPSIIKESVTKVGYDKIILDEKDGTVFLPDKGMKIGFGAIGKGYAADRAKALLMEQGVEAGIINASGDMNTWGTQPNGQEWQVAITNPMNNKKSFGLLPISDRAVVTSGNYKKYVTIDGQQYAHIIDPRSGYPTSGILSVTVFAQKAELADALATSVFVLGIDIGLNRINQLPDVECIIIDDKGAIHKSTNIAIDNNG